MSRPLAPIPRPLADRHKDPHPIEDPALQAEVRAWTVTLLGRMGSGRIVVEFEFHDWKCTGTRLGGTTGRKR